MCKFCESLKDKTKEIKWLVRSTYADDNICECINDQDCGLCDKCDMYFELRSYEVDGNTYVGVEYNQEIVTHNKKLAVIRPFSESIQFNYCPFCGKQISKDVFEFEKGYEMVINNKTI